MFGKEVGFRANGYKLRFISEFADVVIKKHVVLLAVYKDGTLIRGKDLHPAVLEATKAVAEKVADKRLTSRLVDDVSNIWEKCIFQYEKEHGRNY